MKFKAEKTSKGLKILNRPNFDSYVERLDDGTYFLSIEKYEPRRSIDANNYYWHLIGIIKEHLSELGTITDKDTLHEFFKLKFNSEEFLDPVTDKVEQIPKPTSKLNSPDFWQYIEKIKMYCAEGMGLVLPEPNEIGF